MNNYLFLNADNWRSTPGLVMLEEFCKACNTDLDYLPPLITYQGKYWRFDSWSSWYFEPASNEYRASPAGVYNKEEYVRFREVHPVTVTVFK